MPRSEYAPAAVRDQLRIVIVGHVDHGKSTLVGRLIHDTGSLPEGKLEAIKAMCERRGMPFEWAFLMDAFQAERDQGITIDTAQIWLRTPARDYVIIDAPGHREFIKNMITGASSADAALVLIDAGQGIQQQSRFHGFLLHLLGIRQVAVIVNKMDTVGFAKARYDEIREAYTTYLDSIGFGARFVIRSPPATATTSPRPPRHHALVRRPHRDGGAGRPAPDAAPVTELPLRLPIQDIYKFDDRRILVGRVETGRLRVGDRLLFSPSNKTARVASIEGWNVPAAATEAQAGQSVGFTLDEQLFVERGAIASLEQDTPIETNVFRARLVWLGHEPLRVGQDYRLRIATRNVRTTVQAIERLYDTETLSESAEAAAVPRHGVADVILRTRAILALDEAQELPRTGRFVLSDGVNIVAGGIIDMKGYPNQRGALTVKSSNLRTERHRIGAEQRASHNGHRGGVLWFTGLSGSGKSTLAMAIEQELFRRGYNVYVLDGDNVRQGLNANLGFSPEDRAENIRRIGEVAALFADAGLITITSFISPYRADRKRARAAGKDAFHEIYIHADLDTCEKRDPKGLYKKARSGEIAEFTGVSAPYEAPESAELTVDTDRLSIEESVARIIVYVEKNFVITRQTAPVAPA
jgi:bifunctional enzyme CysN/CysC